MEATTIKQDPVHSENHAASYYAATANHQTDYPTLDTDITADVCVVGGGLSGVSTALELSERGYSVVLLEARKIGWGASGRNGGQLIRALTHDTERFRNQIGQEGVDSLDQMGLEAVRIVRERVEKYGIECDLKMGYFNAATRPRHLDELKEELEFHQKLGYSEEMQFLEKDQVSDVVGSDRYIGGLIDRGSGHLHPLNLCIGEARVAEKLGARLFEYSAVKSISYQNRPKVETDKGSVTADKLVLCGNAYMGYLEPRIGGKVLPAGSYIIATESLPESVHKRLMPADMAICDQNMALDYFRLSADKRLLFGGMCNYSGRDPKDIIKAIRPKMLRVFPELEKMKIDFKWGGMIGIGANRMPQVGRVERNVYFAQAYSGHGVNCTHMSGRVIAEEIAGNPERFNVYSKIRHMTFPGGRYLRSPLLAAGMLFHRAKDLL